MCHLSPTSPGDLGSSVSPCGFRGGRNEVWVGFSRGFSRFPLPQISFHHFSTLISSISFHFIRPCDGTTGVIGRYPCNSDFQCITSQFHYISTLDPVLCRVRIENYSIRVLNGVRLCYRLLLIWKCLFDFVHQTTSFKVVHGI